MTHADARSGTAELIYVYGVVRDDFDSGRAPAGLDDATVSTIKGSGASALISRLPRGAYAAEAVEKNSGDVAWLSPRAVAHDRVLTWAHDHGGVVPLPMFTLWKSEQTLSRWLVERSRELTRVFERIASADEFGLRVHRRDPVMMESIHDLDADIARLKREAQAASPGQRYLLERKLADQAKGAVRAASQRMAKNIFERLRALARDAISRSLAPEGGAAPDVTLVLNAAFLVERARNEEFRSTVAQVLLEHEPRGLVFDFTGPWPPYNFVGEKSDGFRGSQDSR